MTFPVERLINWFQKNKRQLPWRGVGDIYKTWVAEVMLQQTQVTTVIPYYLRFLEHFPSVKHLAAASEDAVLKLWEGLGYYNRCRNLHQAAKIIENRFNGTIPGSPGEFGALPGVGPYILAAVMSIARNYPLPAVDGNVIRVYCRFTGITDDIRKPAVKLRIMKELTQIIPAAAPGDFNEAMMEIGALLCSPVNPVCSACPINPACTAHLTAQVKNIPFKSPAKKTPLYRVAIAVILKEKKFFIQKRPAGGHLGGMWEFPGGKQKGNETPEQTVVRECLEELGAKIEITGKLSEIHHAYSHFKIDMHVFLCRPAAGETIAPAHHQPWQWIGIDRLHEFAFPGANHKFFPALEKVLNE